jgi:peptidoglycan hydrolase-like protein with peptidoglycan-binding domain
MKTILGVFCCLVISVGALQADDVTQQVQQRLKDQGFYYGTVDGNGGSETSAAIRRYQIRYGLKVTGGLNNETMRSLGVSGQPEQNAPYASPNANRQGSYANHGYTDADRPTYQNQPDQRYSEDGSSYDSDAQPVIPQQPADVTPQGPRYMNDIRSLFFGTVYEAAPDSVRHNVLYSVQGLLARRRFYRGPVDGEPGPATSDAIARFQQTEDLTINGQLDNPTLDALKAMPGQRYGPPERAGIESAPAQRVYRGIWLR